MKVHQNRKMNVRRKARTFRIVTSIVVPSALVGSFLLAERISESSSPSAAIRPPLKTAAVAGVTAVRTLPIQAPEQISLPSVTLRGYRDIGSINDRRGYAGNPPVSAIPSSVDPASTVTTTPFQTTKVENWRARTGRQFASGAIQIRPTSRDVTPTRSAKMALRTGNQVAAKRFGKRVARLRPTIEFGEFDAPTGDWIDEGSQAGGVESRAIWVVHIAGIESTDETSVVTDFVVVIDDKTGEVLVASEYLV